MQHVVLVRLRRETVVCEIVARRLARLERHDGILPPGREKQRCLSVDGFQRHIDELTCYSDFSILAKDDFTCDFLLNAPGCSFAAASTYGDTWISRRQKNATFLNDSMRVGGSSVAAALGAGATSDWEARLNINVERDF